ncbi:MAG: hypothetical protein Q8O24_09715 [Gallionellaceae bacterium]|nr:hypothetical protein [Gallionellaceae bacterium]
MYPNRFGLPMHFTHDVDEVLPNSVGFALPSPVPPPSSAGWAGDFGEDCLSA